MQIIKSSAEMQETIIKLKKQGKSIGFVPTMGALHEGHFSLVNFARKENDIIAASIFVNPAQFGPNEDFGSYPKTFESDCAGLEKEKCDLLFFPSVKDIYPDGYGTYVNLENKFTEKLCGAKRPGHFRGVATVVSMLFNIVLPDRAYFGLKDYQQVLVIRQMVKDLKFPVQIVPLPTYREKNGLAMSSRNKYLTAEEKEEASIIYKTLCKGKAMIEQGEKDAGKIVEQLKRDIALNPHARIDYLELTDSESLEPLLAIEKRPVLIAAAVFFGKARLIDNILA